MQVTANPLCPPWASSILVALFEATILVRPLNGQNQITAVTVGSSLVCLLEKGTFICVCMCIALWEVCLMRDRCVTGMCLGQVTGETPLGNCKRLERSLSHAVFFLSFLFPPFTQPCGDTLLLLLSPSLPPSLHSFLPSSFFLTDCQEI